MNKFFIFPTLQNGDLFFNLRKTVLLLSYIFFYALFGMIVYYLGILLLNKFFHLSLSVNDLKKAEFSHRNLSYLQMAIFAPMGEELLFRLGLSLKKEHILLAIFYWAFYFLNGSNFSWHLNWDDLGLLGLIFGFLLLIANLPIKKWEGFHIPNWIFYTTSLLLFTLVHIGNLSDLNKLSILLIILYLIPKFVGGYFMTVARLNLGFFYGFLVHAGINSISYLFTH